MIVKGRSCIHLFYVEFSIFIKINAIYIQIHIVSTFNIW